MWLLVGELEQEPSVRLCSSWLHMLAAALPGLQHRGMAQTQAPSGPNTGCFWPKEARGASMQDGGPGILLSKEKKKVKFSWHPHALSKDSVRVDEIIHIKRLVWCLICTQHYKDHLPNN